jgi:DNA (cytosine-5)-methyltransferase 1
MADVIAALRPRVVVIENVAALLRDADAFGWVLADLAAFGFDADWSVLSACAVGAPHTRERLFLVAHPHRVDGRAGLGTGTGEAVPAGHRGPGPWGDPVDGLLEAERGSRRVVDGVPDRLEPARVRALGNAVVPAVAEHLGRYIVAADATGGW